MVAWISGIRERQQSDRERHVLQLHEPVRFKKTYVHYLLGMFRENEPVAASTFGKVSANGIV